MNPESETPKAVAMITALHPSPLTGPWKLRLPIMSTSIKKARDFVASLCEQLRISESITYRALLAVSELATNALQHAPESRAMVVIVFVCDRGLVAEVEDRSDVPPKIRGMAAPESERGRGLAILNEVVELLGWNYIADGGKVVYAVLGGDIAA